MPSDDEDQPNDINEVIDFQQHIYGYLESDDGQLPDQTEESANSEDFGESHGPYTVSPSTSTSSTSSSSLDSNLSLESLLVQLAQVTRQAAQLLNAEYNVPVPLDLIDRIFDMSPNPIPRVSQRNTASRSQQPINTCINFMHQGQSSQPISLIGAFFIIILMILARSQNQVPQ